MMDGNGTLTQKERQWVAVHREAVIAELFDNCEKHESVFGYLPWIIHVKWSESAHRPSLKLCPLHPERAALHLTPGVVAYEDLAAMKFTVPQ